MPHRQSHVITHAVSAKGFAPEPLYGALITGLLDVVAAEPVPARQLAELAARRIAALVGDTCIVSVLSGRMLTPIALGDAVPEGAAVLSSLLREPAPAGERHEIAPYVERFGLAGEFMAPMRARGRVVGQIVVLRRGHNRGFLPAELQLIQSVADVVGLGLGEHAAPVAPPGLPAADTLSRRERQVLGLLALGHTNREIAERVHLSVRTVEWHRARIQAKLHVTGRAALAQVARAYGLAGDADRLA